MVQREFASEQAHTERLQSLRKNIVTKLGVSDFPDLIIVLSNLSKVDLKESSLRNAKKLILHRYK